MTALLRDNIVLIPRVHVAERFRERLMGLMGRSPPGPGYALLLRPCASIHTCFMRFALDAIFLNADSVVVRVVRNIRPWRITWGGARAACVVETEAGWLPESAIQPGDRLTFSSLR
jgi:uncharacterized membrane protein (UPF0127 family)